MITEDLTPQQRDARVTWLLMQREQLTVGEIRQVTGIGGMGVYFMMQNLAVVLPIWKPKTGIWKVLRDEDYEAADG